MLHRLSLVYAQCNKLQKCAHWITIWNFVKKKYQTSLQSICRKIDGLKLYCSSFLFFLNLGHKIKVHAEKFLTVKVKFQRNMWFFHLYGNFHNISGLYRNRVCCTENFFSPIFSPYPCLHALFWLFLFCFVLFLVNKYVLLSFSFLVLIKYQISSTEC